MEKLLTVVAEQWRVACVEGDDVTETYAFESIQRIIRDFYSTALNITVLDLQNGQVKISFTGAEGWPISLTFGIDVFAEKV
jgi:hypothetical protein